MANKNNIAFERCVDFLSRMIEKYGPELSQELSAEKKTTPNT